MQNAALTCFTILKEKHGFRIDMYKLVNKLKEIINNRFHEKCHYFKGSIINTSIGIAWSGLLAKDSLSRDKSEILANKLARKTMP